MFIHFIAMLPSVTLPLPISSLTILVFFKPSSCHHLHRLNRFLPSPICIIMLASKVTICRERTKRRRQSLLYTAVGYTAITHIIAHRLSLFQIIIYIVIFIVIVICSVSFPAKLDFSVSAHCLKNLPENEKHVKFKGGRNGRPKP